MFNVFLFNIYINIFEYKKLCEDIVGCDDGWFRGVKCNVGDNGFYCVVFLVDFLG